MWVPTLWLALEMQQGTLRTVMGRSSRMMIADDNAGDRELLRQAILEIGWNAEIEEAATITQVISSLRRLAIAGTPPDLLLLDFYMCGESCIPVLKTVRGMSGYEHLPIIVMSTTRPLEPERQRCFAFGVAKVLVKAPNYVSLIKTVRILKKSMVGDGSVSGGGSWIGNSDLASLPEQ